MNSFNGYVGHKYFKLGDKILIKNTNFLQGAVITGCMKNKIK